MFLISIYQ